MVVFQPFSESAWAISLPAGSIGFGKTPVCSALVKRFPKGKALGGTENSGCILKWLLYPSFYQKQEGIFLWSLQ